MYIKYFDVRIKYDIIKKLNLIRIKIWVIVYNNKKKDLT